MNKDIIASKENIRLIRFRELGCPNLNSSLSLQIKVKYSPSCQDLGTKLQLLLRHLCLNDPPLINLKRDEATIKASILHLPYEKSFLAYEEDCNTTGTPLKAVWDYEKNEADPSKISPSANMEIHWICPNNPGHRWKTRLYSITTGRSGCPYCAGKHRYSTEEWISRAKEIHGDKFDYSKVLYKSGDEPILIGCPKHGDFMQTPNNHLRSKNGCPLCSTSSNTTLGTEYPELSKMWDGERNQLDFHSSSVLAHSRKKYWWYCTNGKKHSFLAAINEIRSGMNCAVCHGKQVSFDTSLAGMHPELLPLWSSDNEISPDKVSVGSDAKYIWICEKHGPYKAMIRHQIEGRCCCPQCNNHKLTPDQYKERLSVKHPNIELLTDYEKMSVKIRYRCLICGNTSSIRPQDLERRGCSKCHNNPE